MGLRIASQGFWKKVIDLLKGFKLLSLSGKEGIRRFTIFHYCVAKAKRRPKPTNPKA